LEKVFQDLEVVGKDHYIKWLKFEYVIFANIFKKKVPLLNFISNDWISNSEAFIFVQT